MRPFRTIPLACLLSLAAVLPAASQDAAEPTAPTSSVYVERVDVGVVNVTAVVTDRHGRRVTGLTVDDFELLEDGEPVEISNFYAETSARRLEETLARDEALASGEEEVDIVQERQVHLVIYVDNFNMRPENRRRVLPDVLDFVETRLARGDTAMVVGYRDGVTVEQHFTRQLDLVEHALLDMGNIVSGRTQDDLRRRRVLEHMRRSAEERRHQEAYQYVRSYVQESSDELRRSMRALSSVVRSLGGLPGQKALLYLSDGLPKRPGEDLYQALADLFAVGGTEMPGRTDPLQELIDPPRETLQTDQTHLFSSVIREANAGQVTFYTIDARGAVGESGLSAAHPSLAPGTAGRTGLDQLRTQSFQEPLIDLAVATGGAAMLNAFRIRNQLTEVEEDLDSYYSLGFRSRHGGDGKYHEIEVRVKRPGLSARHRAGYFDKPEVVRVADRTFSSLLLGLGKNPLGVEVELGEPERKRPRRYHLPMLARVPLSNVTLLPNGPTHEGGLRFFIAVRDDDGRLSQVHEFEYPVVVAAEQLEEALGRELGFMRTLEVRPGTPEVAVGVWDEVSGTDSYVLIEARVR